MVVLGLEEREDLIGVGLGVELAGVCDEDSFLAALAFLLAHNHIGNFWVLWL